MARQTEMEALIVYKADIKQTPEFKIYFITDLLSKLYSEGYLPINININIRLPITLYFVRLGWRGGGGLRVKRKFLCQITLIICLNVSNNE